LVWVDIMGHAVHRIRSAKDKDRAIDIGQPVGAAVLRRNATGLVVALRDGFGLLDEKSGQVDLVAPVEADVPTKRRTMASATQPVDSGPAPWSSTRRGLERRRAVSPRPGLQGHQSTGRNHAVEWNGLDR